MNPCRDAGALLSVLSPHTRPAAPPVKSERAIFQIKKVRRNQLTEVCGEVRLYLDFLLVADNTDDVSRGSRDTHKVSLLRSPKPPSPWRTGSALSKITLSTSSSPCTNPQRIVHTQLSLRFEEKTHAPRFNTLRCMVFALLLFGNENRVLPQAKNPPALTPIQIPVPHSVVPSPV